MTMYKMTTSWPQHVESGALVNPETNKKYLAWLAEGNTPEPADPVLNPRIAEIKQQLDALDFKKIRPLAAGDTEYLAILQAQTVVLQEELKALLCPTVAEPEPVAAIAGPAR